MGGDAFNVVEEDGAADAIVAAAYSGIGETIFISVTIDAACASFSRERDVSFDMFLWYGHGT